jgi:hypothetical protein
MVTTCKQSTHQKWIIYYVNPPHRTRHFASGQITWHAKSTCQSNSSLDNQQEAKLMIPIINQLCNNRSQITGSNNTESIYKWMALWCELAVCHFLEGYNTERIIPANAIPNNNLQLFARSTSCAYAHQNETKNPRTIWPRQNTIIHYLLSFCAGYTILDKMSFITFVYIVINTIIYWLFHFVHGCQTLLAKQILFRQVNE